MTSTKTLGPISYSDYLATEQILSAQHPRSEQVGQPAHEELLFIITHQTYELWFKQILHELDFVHSKMNSNRIDESQMGEIVSKLDRVVSIFRLLVHQVDVLETMTPLEFLEFRHLLYPASGFQSAQWRAIETCLGLRSQQRLTYNGQSYLDSLSATDRAAQIKREQAPSIRDLTDRWLSRTPALKTEQFDFKALFQKAVEKMLQEDEASILTHAQSEEAKTANLGRLESVRKSFSALFNRDEFESLRQSGQFQLSFDGLHAALLVLLYRDQPLFQLPFRFLSRLQDIDELMTTWRYRHALMASRMLGQKIGTGGSSGHDYLARATESHKVMGDLNKLSTFLIPKSKLPELPKAVLATLQFSQST